MFAYIFTFTRWYNFHSQVITLFSQLGYGHEQGHHTQMKHRTCKLVIKVMDYSS